MLRYDEASKEDGGGAPSPGGGPGEEGTPKPSRAAGRSASKLSTGRGKPAGGADGGAGGGGQGCGRRGVAGGAGGSPTTAASGRRPHALSPSKSRRRDSVSQAGAEGDGCDGASTCLLRGLHNTRVLTSGGGWGAGAQAAA